MPVTFTRTSFSWPDGTTVLDDWSGSFNAGRTGLIGANGSGKTTVLRLIAGDLRPTSGSLAVSGAVAYLPQTVSTAPGAAIADLLGVGPQLAALRAIEAGSTDPCHFDVIGDDWDIGQRAEQTLRSLDALGSALARADLTRPVGALSGGEAMLVAIAGCRLKRAPVTLLDEPTNNLDEVLRAAVVAMVRTWPGTVIVVSHDTGLLEEMDGIAELYGQTLTVFAGTYSQWRQAADVEQAAALQAERAAEQYVRVARRQRAATLERTARNLARGKQKAISEGIDKAGRDKMRGTAEAGAGRARGVADDRVAEAQLTLDEASRRVRPDEHIRLDLPDPDVHASRRILELTWGNGERYIVEGPERVALAGRNGVGKTTLIERMLGVGGRAGGPVLGDEFPRATALTDRTGYLPQRLDNLDDQSSAVENIQVGAPTATSADIRARLARMLIRGEAVFRPVGSLSGGERFRVALARLLFATPPAQLLILDEPTNNLDRTSVDQLVEALSGYRGAILVVSHDRDFLARIGVAVRLELVDAGTGVTVRVHRSADG